MLSLHSLIEDSLPASAFDGYEAPGKRGRAEAIATELDAIEVAGCLRTPVLKHWLSRPCLPDFLRRAILLLTSAAFFLAETGLSGTTTPQRTHSRYSRSLENLSEWRVIRRSRAAVERMFGTYFEVLKTATTSRAILNARPQNEKSQSPPRFSLANFAMIVEVILEHDNFFVADLRHWFYQISIPPGVCRLFSIMCNAQIFEFVVLPMGFSWAPYLAQSICIGLLIMGRLSHNAGNAPPPVITYFNLSKPVGQSLCIYDNILIGTKSEMTMDILLADFHKNVRMVNIAVKEEMRTTSPTFLGVDFIKDGDSLSWKHCAKNTERWLARLERQTTSNRDVAGLVGIVIWDANVHLRPLCYERRAIEALRRTAKAVDCLAAWSNDSLETSEDIASLRESVRSICVVNSPSLRIRGTIREEICIVTDACRNDQYTGWGWLTLENKQIATCSKGEFEESMARKPIFLLELWCALHAINDAIRTHSQRPVHIQLCIDNQAAAQALRKGHSSSEEADLWISETFTHFRDGLNKLTVVQIRSEENPADGLSHGVDPQENRVPLLVARLEEHEGQDDEAHPFHSLGEHGVDFGSVEL